MFPPNSVLEGFEVVDPLYFGNDDDRETWLRDTSKGGNGKASGIYPNRSALTFFVFSQL